MKRSKENLIIGNLEIIKNPDPRIKKNGIIDIEERKKFLRPGEEFSNESIRDYIFSLNKLGISKGIIKEYGCPNIIAINITAENDGRYRSLYIDEPIDVDLFLAGESVSAYDSSGEEYEVYMGSHQVLDWSEEEGNSLFVVRKIK
jgi:hypothetical protein